MLATESSYSAKWYAENREKHLAYMRTKINCPCGKSVNRNTYKRHCECKHHQDWLKINSTCKCGKCTCGGIPTAITTPEKFNQEKGEVLETNKAIRRKKLGITVHPSPEPIKKSKTVIKSSYDEKPNKKSSIKKSSKTVVKASEEKPRRKKRSNKSK